jgi:F420-dependent oxidoreductase-like protein
MNQMRLSTLLPLAGADPAATAAHVADLERSGLDLVWVAEPYGFDAPTMLGYLAAVTSTVQLGAVWRRERLSYDGTFYQVPLPAGAGTGLGKPLKMIGEPVRADIPVYLAALGAKNVELAAAAAQGWLPLFYAPSLAHKVWGDALRAGLARRPPELGELQICAGGIVAIGEDAAALRDLARPQLALYIGGMGAKGRNFYNELFRRYGYEAEAERIQELFLAGQRREAEAAIPASFLEEVTICGPASYVRERLAAYREAGVTVLNVEPAGPGPLGPGTVAQLRSLM